MGENSRRDDLNTLLEYDAYKLGGSFANLYQMQADRVKEQIMDGGLSPSQSKSLVLGLINDYNKYYSIHAKPFSETWDMHQKLATNPNLLDQYNENLPIGQQYTPMEVGQLADIKNKQLNKKFDVNNYPPIFKEDGSVEVFDPMTQMYVKPELLTGLGTYDNLFASQVGNRDIGDLYDWGSSTQAKEVTNVGGYWNEDAAYSYFNSHVNLNNREGQSHRAQLLSSYENSIENSDSDPFFTDAQREAFITKNPESKAYDSVWGEGGLADTLFRKEREMGLWKDATYFEPNTIASDAARRNQRRGDRELQDMIITSGQMEQSAPILNAPATARYIRKVGDSTSISINDGDGLISVIPEYHYINAEGRHILKYSSTGTNMSPEVLNQLAAQGGTGMAKVTSGEIELTGSNYDAVDRYIMAKYGGARLKDLVAGELPKPSPDSQVGSGYVLNDMLGVSESQDTDTPDSSVNNPRPKGYYALNRNDYNLGKFQDVLRDNNVSQDDIDFVMGSKEFYNRLRESGYTPMPGGTKSWRSRVARTLGVRNAKADQNVDIAVSVAMQFLRENGDLKYGMTNE
jgi:hypothetical protein